MRRFVPKLTWEGFSRPFYWLCTHVLRAILTVLARWKVTGREHIPRTGGLIVVANHLNNADPPILGAGVARRRIRFMAKIELFKMPFGVIPKAYGAFPVRRFDSDLRAMLAAERLLASGQAVGMFPEGTRSRTGYMGKPHPGTAIIALRSGATVLPCAITGTEALRNPLVVLKRPRMTITIGEPIHLKAVRRPTEDQVKELTTRIVDAIGAMLPPQYLPPYTDSEEPATADSGEPAHADGGDSSSP